MSQYQFLRAMRLAWRPLSSGVAALATVSLVWSNLGIINGLLFAVIALFFWLIFLTACTGLFRLLALSRARANDFIADSRSNPDHWSNIPHGEFVPSSVVWQTKMQQFLSHVESDPLNILLQEQLELFLLRTVHEGMITLNAKGIEDLPSEYDELLEIKFDDTVGDTYLFLQKHYREVSWSVLQHTVQRRGDDERHYRTRRNSYRNNFLSFASKPHYLAWTIVLLWLFSVWVVGGNRVGESKADWWVYNACQFAFEGCAPKIGDYTKLDALEHLDSTLQTVYPRSTDLANPSILEDSCWYYTREADGEVWRAKTDRSSEFDHFGISFYWKELLDSDPEFGAEYDYYETSRWLVTPPQSGSSWRIVPEIQPEYLEGEYECIP